MARAILDHQIFVEEAGADPDIQESGVRAVTIYETDGTTLFAGTLYDAASGGGVVTNPVSTTANGLLEVWTDATNARRVKLSIAGLAGQRNSAFRIDEATAVTTDTAQTITAIKTLTSPRFLRPFQGSGLIFTPEYFYLAAGLALADLNPGVTDETTYIQQAINAAVAAGGGIVQFEPRKYNFSKLNVTASLASQAPSGAIAAITLQGQRAQSTGPITQDWGTFLSPGVAAGSSNTAKTRSLIDVSGSTYVTIRNCRLGKGNVDTYGSGTVGGTAANVNPAAAIMASGALNPNTLAGWESTSITMENCLVDGYYTTGTLVLGAYSFGLFVNCQFYNYKFLGVGDTWATSTPSATQVGGHALVLAGANAVNPNLPDTDAGAGFSASAYGMYSEYVTVTPQDQYNGCSNHVFVNCQFWTQGSAARSAVRMTDTLNCTFIGGAAGVPQAVQATVPIFEVVDDTTVGNSPVASALNRWIGFEFERGAYAIYVNSDHQQYGFVLQGCDFFEIQNAWLGARDSASQKWQALQLLQPRQRGTTAPTNGAMNNNNTNDVERVVTRSHLECNGKALTTVGGIDGSALVFNRGTYSSGHANQVSKALDFATTGTRLPNNVALLGLTSAGAERAMVRLNASNESDFGEANAVSKVIGSTVNILSNATTRITANTNGVAFNGATPAAAPALGAAATDLATAITLVNNIRSLLQGNGQAT